MAMDVETMARGGGMNDASAALEEGPWQQEAAQEAVEAQEEAQAAQEEEAVEAQEEAQAAPLNPEDMEAEEPYHVSLQPFQEGHSGFE